MTEIVPVQAGGMPTGAEIDTAVRIAQNLAAGGMFKDARQAEQAFTKIMLGRDLGLSPTQAMTSIHVVEGKPELSANLQAQLVKSYRGPDGERYDYLVREHTDQVCEIEFRRREVGGDWETLGVERFTITDAERAGLAGRKGPWQTYPRNMLWARCISNGVNFHCPEVARGLRVYHEGEISGVEQPVDTPPPPPAPTPAPDVAPLVSEEQAATILQGVRLLAEHDVRSGTLLVAHGATVCDNLEDTVATVPADQADPLCKALSDLLDQVSADAEVIA